MASGGARAICHTKGGRARDKRVAAGRGRRLHPLARNGKQRGWKVTERGGTAPVVIEPRHICVLFRRFVSWDEDITRPYVEAMEARGVPHSARRGTGRSTIVRKSRLMRAALSRHRMARR